jgi:hypothetical protein
MPLAARSKSLVGSFHGRTRPASAHNAVAASLSVAVSSRMSINEVSSIRRLTLKAGSRHRGSAVRLASPTGNQVVRSI